MSVTAAVPSHTAVETDGSRTSTVGPHLLMTNTWSIESHVRWCCAACYHIVSKALVHVGVSVSSAAVRTQTIQRDVSFSSVCVCEKSSLLWFWPLRLESWAEQNTKTAETNQLQLHESLISYLLEKLKCALAAHFHFILKSLRLIKTPLTFTQ